MTCRRIARRQPLRGDRVGKADAGLHGLADFGWRAFVHRVVHGSPLRDSYAGSDRVRWRAEGPGERAVWAKGRGIASLVRVRVGTVGDGAARTRQILADARRGVAGREQQEG